jgi:hypothetical protein
MEVGLSKFKMNKNKIITKGMLIIVTILFLLSSARAFAVSAKYYGGNSLYILPGESKEVPFVLENLDGASDISVKLQINTGKEFIKINDPSDVYVVPLNGRTTVNLTMTVPADAKLDEIYPVTLNFVTISKSESGTFALTGAISQSFNAIIGTGLAPPENKISTGLIILIIIIVLAAGATIFCLAKRKKGKKKKN